MKQFCDRLNGILAEKKEGFVDTLNLVMEEVTKNGGSLYWDRQVFLDCNCNEKRMRKMVRETDLVHFEPSDDPEEHPGVVVRYKKKA